VFCSTTPHHITAHKRQPSFSVPKQFIIISA
jgi:hypothetical protein